MNALFSNKYFWLLLILFGLQIPLSMIEGQIEQRVVQRDIARTAVRNSWTGEQDILAALLVVPYQEKQHVKQNDNLSTPVSKEYQWVDRQLFITPEKLSVSANLKNQTLSKGLYEVPVYTASVSIEGNFSLSKYHTLINHKNNSAQDNFRLQGKPFVAIGVKDIRGVVGIPYMTINQKSANVFPGSKLAFYPKGFNAEVLSENMQASSINFSNNIMLNGMEKLSFLAMARENTVTAQSDWPHPIFEGAFLPASRDISAEGYSANWKTGVFSTNINTVLEDCFMGQCASLNSSLFGVHHVQSVDIYLQSLRSIKYGFLVILVTFCIFILYEILGQGFAIHPISYILTGAALVIFFLLLIALSEHINFLLAYWISCFACSALIAYYISFQSRSLKQGGYIMGILNSLYLILFFIIRSEDHALLSGSLLLFFLLAIIMFITRKIDWYLVLSSNK